MSRAARLARIEGDVALLRERNLTIEAFARDILREQPGTDRLLLVVDQWEELYAQAKSLDDRQRFLDLILQATTDGAVTVVLTLRGDFYGRALEDRAFADRLQNAVVNLGPMRREELKRAVTEPAAKVGLGFEDGLVDRILDEVGSEPGNLPLLEFLLTELWARRERGLLTHAAYAAIGGVKGAIATRAEAELERLTPEQREALRRVMIRLVTPGEGQADTRATAECVTTDNVAARIASPENVLEPSSVASLSLLPLPHRSLPRQSPIRVPFSFLSKSFTAVGPVELWATRTRRPSKAANPQGFAGRRHRRWRLPSRHCPVSFLLRRQGPPSGSGRPFAGRLLAATP